MLVIGELVHSVAILGRGLAAWENPHVFTKQCDSYTQCVENMHLQGRLWVHTYRFYMLVQTPMWLACKSGTWGGTSVREVSSFQECVLNREVPLYIYL